MALPLYQWILITWITLGLLSSLRVLVLSMAQRYEVRVSTVLIAAFLMIGRSILLGPLTGLFMRPDGER